MKNFLYFNLMKMVANCLTQDQALGDKFQVQQAAFLGAFDRLDKALKISRKSLLTPEIQELDAVRTQQWRVFRAAVRDMLNMPTKAIANAADFVMSLITNHGDVPNMKVNERTGALINLCQDLTEKYADQVAVLGMTGFATQLAATNAQYLQKYEERLHAWSEYNREEVVKSREATDDTIENLLIMVASGIISEGMAPYKHFVDYVNEAIKVAKVAMGSPTTKPDGTPPSDGAEEDPDNTPDNTDPDNGNTPGDTLTPDPDAPNQNPNPTPGEGNGENEDEYTPPDNDGGFGK